MRRPAVAALALLAVLVPAGAARADYVIDGRGFGHGVGMSQYGAYGYALREGRDFRWILGHYYTATSVGSAPAGRMRVLLRRTRAHGAPECAAHLRGHRVGRHRPAAHGHRDRPPPRPRAGADPDHRRHEH